MQEVIFGVNIVFSVFMIALCVWDYKSYVGGIHRDLKSIIMSTGVLGTFVGIFVGLWGFDTAHLENSVPLLLDGLKTAFYTSILGMGLAIILAILQKRTPLKSDEESNLEYLAKQAQHFTHLHTLPQLLEHIQTLPSTQDIHSLYERNNALMQSQFSLVNHTLQEAVSQLAKGASQELIGALESVIKDFNTNLQDQFGENFKELNSAVVKLLQWQEEYKDFVQESKALLMNTQQSLDNAKDALSHTAMNLEKITEQNTKVQEFYAATLRLMQSFESTQKDLAAHLEAIASLEGDSKQCLQNLQTFFVTANEGSQTAKQYISTLVENIAEYSKGLGGTLQTHITQSAEYLKESIDSHTHTLDSQLQIHRDSLTQLAQDNFSNLKAFSKDIIAHSTQNIESILKECMQVLQAEFSSLTQSTHTLIQTFGNEAKEGLESLLGQIENFAQESKALHTQNLEGFRTLKDEISTQHKTIIETFSTQLLGMQEQHQKALHTALNADLQRYREGIDSLMQGIEGAKNQSLELSKHLAENLQTQYQQAHTYIKSLALEYLKVLQKLSKESVRIPKDTSTQILAEFGNFQKQIMDSMSKTQGDITQNVAHLHSLYENLGQYMRRALQDNATLSEDMQDSLRNLDKAMSASVDSFWQNYEWFLERIKELIGTRR